MKKYKKILLVSILSLVSFVTLVIVFISPLTKYLIERYDEKYLGRQITLNWAYVNPFTGYAYLRNVTIYEENNDSVFCSTYGLSLDINLKKLLSKTYQLNELKLDKPVVTIVQNKNDFNFNSILEKFKSKEKPDTNKAPVLFSILSIKIKEGEVFYCEKLIPVNYSIKKLTIESSGPRWDTDTITTQFSFATGIGVGDVKGKININTKTLEYNLSVLVQKFELRIIEQFLKELTNYGTFSANLDADIKAKGNFNSKEDITAKGFLAINEFHFGKNHYTDFASFDKLVFQIKELSPKNKKYLFDSISINRPYFKYERYDYLDNIETIFGKKGANVKAINADEDQFNLVIEIAKYIKVLAKNFFKSDYKINKLAVYNGNLIFNDYSISEKFELGLNPIFVNADSINKNRNRVELNLNSGINPFGSLAVKLSISPKDSSSFDLRYHIQNISAPMLNPYLLSYTSFPLNRGIIELNGNWAVKEGEIKSTNHVLIIDPKLSSRLKNKELKWLPMNLSMFFIRERGNVIDYQIPISGNLNSPKLHVYDILTDILKNIFVKPVTTPYRMEVKNLETKVEKGLTVKWAMRNANLNSDQKKFLNLMATFLKNNPKESIAVLPILYSAKEKEYILFFEAKKKYYLINHTLTKKSFTKKDSITVERMSVKDTLFVDYLNKLSHNPLLFTIQEKCAASIDSSVVNSKFNWMNNQRKTAFLSCFKEHQVENQVRFLGTENSIPFNGYSFYKIEYKDELPEFIASAYRKMANLNSKSPRDKFKKYRLKNKTME